MSFTSFGLVKSRTSSSVKNVQLQGRPGSRRDRARATALWVAAGAAGFSVWASNPAHAAATNASGTYTAATGGGWSVGGSWSTNPDYPSGTNAAAILAATQTANRSITIDVPVTLRSLSAQNDVSFTNSIATGAGAPLLFDGGGNGVSINVSGTGTGNLTISTGSTFNDNVTAVVSQTSQSSTAGALNWTGTITGAGGFTKQGAGLMTFGTGTKQYTGPTVLDTDSGRTRISVAASPTKTSSFTVKSGAQITMTGSNGSTTWGTGNLNLNGTGIAQFPGVIRNDTNFAYGIGNPVVLQSDSLIHVQGAATGLLTLSGGVSGPGALSVTAPDPASNNDIGTLALTGAGSYTGATIVYAGTLKLGATTGAAAGGTSSITLHTNTPGSRGVLQIDAPNQINDAAPLTLDNATFRTGGNVEGGFNATTGKGVAGVGPLTVTGGSDIDLGAGSSIVAFATSAASPWGGTLKVLNWTGNADTGGGTDRLFFGSDTTGLTPAQLAAITFYSDAGTTPIGTSNAILSTGEVVPVVNGVPEPGSLALLGLGAAGLLARRRRR